MRVRVGLLAAVCIVTVGCGGGGEMNDAPANDQNEPSARDEPEESEPAGSDAEAPESASSEYESGCPYVGNDAVAVSPDCIDPWPLTADSAEVFCEPAQQALVRVEGQGVYPLNGMAMSQQPDLPELEAICARVTDRAGAYLPGPTPATTPSAASWLIAFLVGVSVVV